LFTLASKAIQIMSDYHRNADVAKGGASRKEQIMWTRIKRWWAVEGAMVSLQGMSDRQLADMGLQREGLRDRVVGMQPDRKSETPAPGACRPAAASARC
jgi:uncharacterized protein YjiS (DUF1127 family)